MTASLCFRIPPSPDCSIGLKGNRAAGVKIRHLTHPRSIVAELAAKAEEIDGSRDHRVPLRHLEKQLGIE